MVKNDMRFNTDIIKKLVGKNFIEYKCDPFAYTESVSQICGLYIDKEVYKLSNVQQEVDYFGNTDDIAVYSISEASDGDISSCYEDTVQVITPVKESIRAFTLVNEHQMISKDGVCDYDVWLTRGIIIHTETREYAFIKSTVPFSEEIEIYKGNDLISKFDDGKDFLEGWEDNIVPSVEQEKIIIE